jgi:hypothetical protein
VRGVALRLPVDRRDTHRGSPARVLGGRRRESGGRG